MIVDLRATIADLQAQRKRWLGSQLNEPSMMDTEALADLRITDERVVADAQGKARQLDEARRLVQVLEGYLAASRLAHAEDVQRLSAGTENVVAFGRHQRIVAD